MVYDVTVQRDGRFWFIQVPALGQVTQARNDAEIPLMAKELIEVVTGEIEPSIEVRFIGE